MYSKCDSILLFQVDTFIIEAVTLDNLERLVLEHDGKGYGAGWFCDKVVVKKQGDDSKEYVFQCGRWLDDHEDDCLTSRELVLSGMFWSEMWNIIFYYMSHVNSQY